MVKYINLQDKKTIIIGDIHGDFHYLMANFEENDVKNCNVIVAGDIGLGFYHVSYYNELFAEINNVLKTRKINLYLLRGNHDNPKFFKNNFVGSEFIKVIEDYTVLKTQKNGNILCVGGGASVDRKARRASDKRRINMALFNAAQCGLSKTVDDIKEEICLTYWDDELPVYDEENLVQIKNDGVEINHVVTHTSPKFCFKYDRDGIKYWIINDIELSNLLDNEREALSKVYQKLIDDKHPIQDWTYAHFHDKNEEVINGITFRCLLNLEREFDFKTL